MSTIVPASDTQRTLVSLVDAWLNTGQSSGTQLPDQDDVATVPSSRTVTSTVTAANGAENNLTIIADFNPASQVACIAYNGNGNSTPMSIANVINFGRNDADYYELTRLLGGCVTLMSSASPLNNQGTVGGVIISPLAGQTDFSAEEVMSIVPDLTKLYLSGSQQEGVIAFCPSPWTEFQPFDGKVNATLTGCTTVTPVMLSSTSAALQNSKVLSGAVQLNPDEVTGTALTNFSWPSCVVVPTFSKVIEISGTVIVYNSTAQGAIDPPLNISGITVTLNMLGNGIVNLATTAQISYSDEDWEQNVYPGAPQSHTFSITIDTDTTGILDSNSAPITGDYITSVGIGYTMFNSNYDADTPAPDVPIILDFNSGIRITNPRSEYFTAQDLCVLCVEGCAAEQSLQVAVKYVTESTLNAAQQQIQIAQIPKYDAAVKTALTEIYNQRGTLGLRFVGPRDSVATSNKMIANLAITGQQTSAMSASVPQRIMRAAMDVHNQYVLPILGTSANVLRNVMAENALRSREAHGSSFLSEVFAKTPVGALLGQLGNIGGPFGTAATYADEAVPEIEAATGGGGAFASNKHMRVRKYQGFSADLSLDLAEAAWTPVDDPQRETDSGYDTDSSGRTIEDPSPFFEFGEVIDVNGLVEQGYFLASYSADEEPIDDDQTARRIGNTPSVLSAAAQRVAAEEATGDSSRKFLTPIEVSSLLESLAFSTRKEVLAQLLHKRTSYILDTFTDAPMKKQPVAKPFDAAHAPVFVPTRPQPSEKAARVFVPSLQQAQKKPRISSGLQKFNAFSADQEMPSSSQLGALHASESNSSDSSDSGILARIFDAFKRNVSASRLVPQDLLNAYDTERFTSIDDLIDDLLGEVIMSTRRTVRGCCAFSADGYQTVHGNKVRVKTDKGITVSVSEDGDYIHTATSTMSVPSKVSAPTYAMKTVQTVTHQAGEPAAQINTTHAVKTAQLLVDNPAILEQIKPKRSAGKKMSLKDVLANASDVDSVLDKNLRPDELELTHTMVTEGEVEMVNGACALFPVLLTRDGVVHGVMMYGAFAGTPELTKEMRGVYDSHVLTRNGHKVFGVASGDAIFDTHGDVTVMPVFQSEVYTYKRAPYALVYAGPLVTGTSYNLAACVIDSFANRWTNKDKFMGYNPEDYPHHQGKGTGAFDMFRSHHDGLAFTGRVVGRTVYQVCGLAEKTAYCDKHNLVLLKREPASFSSSWNNVGTLSDIVIFLCNDTQSYIGKHPKEMLPRVIRLKYAGLSYGKYGPKPLAGINDLTPKVVDYVVRAMDGGEELDDAITHAYANLQLPTDGGEEATGIRDPIPEIVPQHKYTKEYAIENLEDMLIHWQGLGDFVMMAIQKKWYEKFDHVYDGLDDEEELMYIHRLDEAFLNKEVSSNATLVWARLTVSSWVAKQASNAVERNILTALYKHASVIRSVIKATALKPAQKGAWMDTAEEAYNKAISAYDGAENKLSAVMAKDIAICLATVLQPSNLTTFINANPTKSFPDYANAASIEEGDSPVARNENVLGDNSVINTFVNLFYPEESSSNKHLSTYDKSTKIMTAVPKFKTIEKFISWVQKGLTQGATPADLVKYCITNKLYTPRKNAKAALTLGDWTDE